MEPQILGVHMCIEKVGKLKHVLPEQFPLPASASLLQFPLTSVWSGEAPCSEHLLCLQPKK